MVVHDSRDVTVQPHAGDVVMTEERGPIGTESDALSALRNDLVREYGTIVPTGTIEQVAKQALAEFDDVSIRKFVPVLAWRRARLRLRRTL
jgi:hypothetical protein